MADVEDFTVTDVEDFTDVSDVLLTDAFTEVDDFADSDFVDSDFADSADFADVAEDFVDAATEVFDVSATDVFDLESETTDFAEVDD